MHTHIDTHHLLDIEGASRHSVVPVPQLVVLGADHQPSGGLVLSDIAGWKRREIRQQKEEKTDLRGLEELPLSTCEPCHEGSMMMHTQSGWLTGGVAGDGSRGKKIGYWEAGVSLSSGFLLRLSHCGQDGMRWWINSTKKGITRPTIAGTQEVTISPQTASPQVSPTLARPEWQVTPHAALQRRHAHEHTRQQGQAEFISLVTRELITVCCPWYRFSNLRDH